MMTLSEAIASAKHKENEVYKQTQLRKSILLQPFDEKKYLGQQEEYTAEEFNKHKEDFNFKKKEKITQTEEKIKAEIEDVIRIRNAVNKKNIEIGQDSNLIRMKWLRIQLDNLMKDVGTKKKRMWDEDSFINREMYEELGLGLRLKELEMEKNELDAKIQKLNHTVEIEL